MRRQLACLLLAGILAGCASHDRVTFVTSTNIAIDADATTQSLSIGYHRREGYLGPAYENGAVPPIVAKLKSNLSILDPRIHQFYATGKAAILATCKGGKALESGTGAAAAGPECPPIEEPPLKGNRRLMFFGTGSVIGFKIGWAGNVPESVTLGYKRKEFSTLPIGREQTDGASPAPAAAPAAEDAYGSVLASIDMDTKVLTPDDTAVGLGQFFATGVAAQNLANNSVIRAAVEKEAEKSAQDSLQTVSFVETETVKKFERRVCLDFPECENIDETALPAIRACYPEAGIPPGTLIMDVILRPEFADKRELVAACMGL
jgi:hypothetical protein